MMNWIWFGFVVASLLFAAFTGSMKQVGDASFNAAQEAVKISLEMVGVMALWLGIMRVAQDGGLMKAIARVLRSPMRWLFPDVPAEHPAMSAMIMNFSANILGLGNAATPFGLKAIAELDKLNRHKGTATNAMCLFVAIVTSGLSILPLGVINYRKLAGSQAEASIWLPTILATTVSTASAIFFVKLLQRMRRFSLPVEVDEDSVPPSEDAQAAVSTEGETVASEKSQRANAVVRWLVWLCVLAFAGGAIYRFTQMGGSDWMAIAKEYSNWLMPGLMLGLLLFGVYRRVRIYESLITGAKEGFDIMVKIIPYLVAIMVAVGMFKASGAMDLLKHTVGVVTEFFGMPTEVLPMAIIRPLSGSGATGVMLDVFKQSGPDSLSGQMVSVMSGSMDTTFYILAVYFGSVQVTRVRHALAGGLIADLGGIIASVALCHLFF